MRKDSDVGKLYGVRWVNLYRRRTSKERSQPSDPRSTRSSAPMVRPASELHGVVPGRYGMSRAMRTVDDGAACAPDGGHRVAAAAARGWPLTEGAKPAVPFGGSSASSLSLSTARHPPHLHRDAVQSHSLIHHLQRGGRSSTGASTSYRAAARAAKLHQRRLVQGHRRCGLPERGVDPPASRAWSGRRDHIYKMATPRISTSTSGRKACRIRANCAGRVAAATSTSSPFGGNTELR
jgi:hypothetical protein